MKVLVRTSNWLGDAVMNIPALEALKAKDPSGHLAVLAIPSVAEVFADRPAVDEVIVYDRKGKDRGFGVVRLAMELHKRRFDEAYVFPNSFRSVLLPWMAQIPRRTGYKSGPRDPFLFPSIQRPRALQGVHEVRHYLHLVGADKGEVPVPKVYVGESNIARARRLLFAKRVSLNVPLVGLCPGATYGPAKRWFPESFGAVGAHFARDWEACVAVFGVNEERSIADTVMGLVFDRTADFVGATTVGELAAIFDFCAVVVTNDTGTMHLAAAVGAPVVAVFGSTDPVATGPLGPNVKVLRKPISCSPCLKRTCPYGHYDCMRKISVEEVISAVNEVARIPGSCRTI